MSLLRQLLTSPSMSVNPAYIEYSETLEGGDFTGFKVFESQNAGIYIYPKLAQGDGHAPYASGLSVEDLSNTKSIFLAFTRAYSQQGNTPITESIWFKPDVGLVADKGFGVMILLGFSGNEIYTAEYWHGATAQLLIRRIDLTTFTITGINSKNLAASATYGSWYKLEGIYDGDEITVKFYDSGDSLIDTLAEAGITITTDAQGFCVNSGTLQIGKIHVSDFRARFTNVNPSAYYPPTTIISPPLLRDAFHAQNVNFDWVGAPAIAQDPDSGTWYMTARYHGEFLGDWGLGVDNNGTGEAIALYSSSSKFGPWAFVRWCFKKSDYVGFDLMEKAALYIQSDADGGNWYIYLAVKKTVEDWKVRLFKSIDDGVNWTDEGALITEAGQDIKTPSVQHDSADGKVYLMAVRVNLTAGWIYESDPDDGETFALKYNVPATYQWFVKDGATWYLFEYTDAGVDTLRGPQHNWDLHSTTDFSDFTELETNITPYNNPKGAVNSAGWAYLKPFIDSGKIYIYGEALNDDQDGHETAAMDRYQRHLLLNKSPIYDIP